MMMADEVWHQPPTVVTLPENEVHVWRVPLVQPAQVVAELAPILSEDEQERAGRFHFEKHRQHFIVARGLLRRILGRYLEVVPERIQFGYSDHGKPFVTWPSGHLHFNLSHSHRLALCAVTRVGEIGIDIEHLERRVEEAQIAERFFSPKEVGMLRALPKSLHREAFFNGWTRKEAYIKAIGEGLSLPLDQFDVSLAPGEPAALLGTRGDPEEVARWSLRALSPGTGYVAALVVEGHDWQLQCWQWTSASIDD